MANAQEKSAIGEKPAERIPPESPHDAGRSSGTLDLNQAGEAEIAEIDMIGKKLAHVIVEQRALAGGFQSWDELKRVPGANRASVLGLPDIAMRVWLQPDRMAQLGITVQEVSAAGLRAIGPCAVRLSAIEGLDAHGNAVRLRLERAA